MEREDDGTADGRGARRKSESQKKTLKGPPGIKPHVAELEYRRDITRNSLLKGKQEIVGSGTSRRDGELARSEPEKKGCGQQ